MRGEETRHDPTPQTHSNKNDQSELVTPFFLDIESHMHLTSLPRSRAGLIREEVEPVSDVDEPDTDEAPLEDDVCGTAGGCATHEDQPHVPLR